MRRTAKLVVTVGALAILAVPVAAQRGPGPGMGHRMGPGMMRGGPAAMMRNPAEVVLEHRDVLELTDDQVVELEAIRDRLEAENGPRIEQLKQAFGEVDPEELSLDERKALRERMRELAPVRAEIRATNQAAGEEIHGVLNDEQERALFAIMRADRPGHRRGMRGGRGPGGPRGGGPNGR